MSFSFCTPNCETEEAGSILEALLCAVVNKEMGEKERHINLSLAWLVLQQPGANGSYGHRCCLRHKLTQILFQLSHIYKALHRWFIFPYGLHAYVHVCILHKENSYLTLCLHKRSLTFGWCTFTSFQVYLSASHADYQC